MRKYYLFIIRQEYAKMYQKQSYVLYRMLEKLFRMSAYDFSFGSDIFKELCSPFAVPLLNNYIKNRIHYKKINSRIIKIESMVEKTYLQIGYPCIVILTNVNRPQILKIFNIYNRNIFLCDFEHEDYVWLKQTQKRV